MKIFRKLLAVVIIYLCSFVHVLQAQCVMCRATIESNMSEGSDLVTGINGGVLYLAAFPYLMLVAMAYYWYKNSKKRSDEKSLKITGTSPN